MSSSTWQSGVSGDWTNGSDWSSGSPSSLATANITANGNYVVTLFGSAAAAGLVLNAQGAEFYDAGALNLSGTLALQAGTLALAYGAINGGTLAMQGGSLLASGGTLNGVTVDGVLNMSGANSTLFVQNGLTLTGASGSGSGSGSIALTGAYASLDYIGSQTLANTVVALGSIGSQPGQTGPAAIDITHAGGTTSGATLTIGASSWVRDSGGQAQLVAGNVSPVMGAALPDTLINQGTITASGVGATLSVVGNGNFVNQGMLSVSGGALLQIATAGFQNTGTISVSNATLALGGTYSAATLNSLGAVALSNGQVELLGLARNSGTLTLGTGTSLTGSLGALALAGTLAGGTVADNGGGMNFAAGTGTLSGVVYQGMLALGTSAAAVTLAGNTQITGAAGATGTASITGNAASLLLQGNETLASATITLGAAGQAASIGTSDPWLASTATTATLGAGVTVQQGGANAALNANAFSPIAGFGLSDTLVNQGNILANYAGGQMTIGGYGSFLNQGAITIGNADTLTVSAQQFGNTGTITVGAGGTMMLGGTGTAFGAATSWSNAGLIAVTGGTLALGGTLTTTQLGSVTESSGAVQLNGTLNNAGTTLSLGAASLNSVALNGAIVGGTIADSSAALAVGSSGAALLDGVTDNGTLSVTQSGAFLRVRDGLTVNGTANITGAGAIVDFVGAQSFNNAHVNLGAAGTASVIEVTHGSAGAGPSLLSLGGSLCITQTGQCATIGAAGGMAGDGIVNSGTITGGIYGGTLTLGGQVFTNQGTIGVSNGETLSLQAAQFSNTGTIAVSGAALSLGGSLSLASLGQMVLSNAAIAVTGTLNLGGGTVTIGAGSALGRVALTGTMSGGTIIDNGSGLAGAGAGDLAGVTYRGLLDLSRPFAQLSISQGITLTGQSGSGTGSLALTGAAARLISASTETLNNATITLGSAAQTYLGQALAAPELDAAAGTQLTIGATATLNAAGTAGTLGNAGLGQWTDSIVNAGHINAAVAAGTLTIGSSSFTNSGVLCVTNGGVLVLGSAATTNTGTLSIGAGSTVQLGLYNYFADPLAGAQQFTNQGSILLAGGTFHEMTSNGLFPGVPVVNQGMIAGTGIVATALSNGGTLDAHGGTLSMQGPVTGAGTLLIDAGATLDLAGAVASTQIARFTSNTGTLKIEQPSSFAGQVANVVGGDVINLVGQTLTNVALASGALVAKTATSQYTVHGTTALTGTVEVASDGHGGSNIAIIPTSTGTSGALVVGVTQPKMMFFTAAAGDAFTGSTANMNGLTACNWSNASSLDITDLSPTAAKLTATAGTASTTLAFTDGTHVGSLILGAALSQSHFTLASDGHGGTLITTH